MNHSYRLTAVVAAFGALLGTGLLDAAEPQSYPLLCRAGNNTIEIDNRMDQITSTVRVTSSYIKLTFTRAGRPASAGLASGNCAWTDRGVNNDEPAVLRLYFQNARLVPTIRRVDGSDRVGYEVQGRSRGADDLRRFIEAFQNGREFQVHAYNNRRGSLVASRYGP